MRIEKYEREGEMEEVEEEGLRRKAGRLETAEQAVQVAAASNHRGRSRRRRRPRASQEEGLNHQLHKKGPTPPDSQELLAARRGAACLDTTAWLHLPLPALDT